MRLRIQEAEIRVVFNITKSLSERPTQRPFTLLLANHLPLILVNEMLVLLIPTLLFPWGTLLLAQA